MDQGSALQMLWLLEDLFRANWGTIGRIHRPDLFVVALRDMPGSLPPQSVCKLAKQLDLSNYTIWRERMLVFP